MTIMFDKEKIGKVVPFGKCVCIYNYGETLRVIYADKTNQDMDSVVSVEPERFLATHKNVIFDETFSYDMEWKIRYSRTPNNIRNEILDSIYANSYAFPLTLKLQELGGRIFRATLNVIVIIFVISTLVKCMRPNSQPVADGNPLDIVDTISDNTVLPLESGKYVLTEYDIKGDVKHTKEITIDEVDGHRLVCNNGNFWIWYSNDGCSIMENNGIQAYKVNKYRLENVNNPKIYVTEYHLP